MAAAAATAALDAWTRIVQVEPVSTEAKLVLSMCTGTKTDPAPLLKTVLDSGELKGKEFVLDFAGSRAVSIETLAVTLTRARSQDQVNQIALTNLSEADYLRFGRDLKPFAKFFSVTQWRSQGGIEGTDDFILDSPGRAHWSTKLESLLPELVTRRSSQRWTTEREVVDQPAAFGESRIAPPKRIEPAQFLDTTRTPPHLEIPAQGIRFSDLVQFIAQCEQVISIGVPNPMDARTIRMLEEFEGRGKIILHRPRQVEA